MKQILTMLALFCAFAYKTYAQKLTFSYDQAGNQQNRTWICVNCMPISASKPDVTEILREIVKKGDSVKIATRKIIASPNPTVETLNINWETEQNVSVKQIKAYTIQGSKVHELHPLPSEKSVSFRFQHLPVGTYILEITFSDRSKEIIKIIKK